MSGVSQSGGEPPFSARAILDQLASAEGPAGGAARKSLGQHFLLDPSVTARIAAQAGSLRGRAVFEIGPGPGGLTAALLAAGAERVIAIERDRRFAAALRGLGLARLTVIEADALGVDEAALLAQHSGASEAPIIANLPYNIATLLVIKWLKSGPWRGPMTLMFQKEVAERLCAAPNSSAYGRLSVLAQTLSNPRIVMKLAAGAFSPPPKVASAVVQFSPAAGRGVAEMPPELERVSEAAFGQRRKMLRRALAALAERAGVDLGEWLRAAAIAPEARAETLSVAEFHRLAQEFAARSGRRTDR